LTLKDPVSQTFYNVVAYFHCWLCRNCLSMDGFPRLGARFPKLTF